MGDFIGRREEVNLETGEIRDVISFVPEAKDENWIKAFRLLSFRVLADLRENGLNGATDILFWFMDKLHDFPTDVMPEIYAPHDVVAQEIGTTARTVARYIEKLIALKYIRQIKPRTQVYQVNPDMLFKGKLSKFKGQRLLAK